MKEVYTIPDRHTRYIATKEFFRAKITSGSSVQEHGVKMLSLVEKLEDLKVGLENDTLEKSINELINMLVQYEATIKKYVQSVLIREPSTSKGKRRRSRANDICAHCHEKGHWKRDCPNLSSDQGHFSQDRMKRLVDSKNLEIDNLDNLPACESCLKGKMTRKPFVGQSKLANGLFDLIHTDICGPLNTQARGGFSYFIMYTDDHSQYGEVYLMRYKSEAFVRFKEFSILWTPSGMPQLNGVAERRNRTLLDMIRSMMSFTELPLSFWGYALEMAARLFNIASSKTVAQTPYQIRHGKPASYKYLRVWDSPAYVRRLVGDKLDSKSSLCRFMC
ncbi:UNVERIFIED_CONTAM: hypothetical protein Sangu_3203200 [Sesamum angustifolium]|uniref:Retrotransposon protein, putative, Ty1-copia subclass n=1 Tax=Sesamum angustifolium TaxID=2727405 RepID=A0AAW2JKP7_9LAMI